MNPFSKESNIQDLPSSNLDYLRSHIQGKFSPSTGFKYGFGLGNRFNTLDSFLTDSYQEMKIKYQGGPKISAQEAKDRFNIEVDGEYINESWAKYKRDRQAEEKFYQSIVSNVNQDVRGGMIMPFTGALVGGMVDGSSWALGAMLGGVPLLAKAGQSLKTAMGIKSMLGAKLATGLVYDISEEAITQGLLSISREEVLDRSTTAREVGEGLASAVLFGGTLRTIGHVWGNYRNAETKPFEQMSDELASYEGMAQAGRNPVDDVSSYYRDRVRELEYESNLRLDDQSMPSHIFYSVHDSVDGSLTRNNQITPYNAMGRGFSLFGDLQPAQRVASVYNKNYSIASVSLGDANLFDANVPLNPELKARLSNLLESELGGVAKGWILGDLDSKSLTPVLNDNVSLYDILERVAKADKNNTDLELFNKIHDFFEKEGYDGYYIGNTQKGEIAPNSVHIINESLIPNIESNTKAVTQNNPQILNKQKAITFDDSIPMGMYSPELDGPRLLEYRTKTIQKLNDYYRSVESHPMYNRDFHEIVQTSYKNQKGIMNNEDIDISDITNRVGELSEQVSYLKEELKQTMETLEELKTRKSEVSKKSKESKDAIKSKVAEIKKLESLKRSSVKIDTPIKDIDNRIKKLQSEMDVFNSELAPLVDLERQLDIDIKKSKGKINPMEKVREFLEKDLDELLEPTRSPDKVKELSKAFLFCRRMQ